MDDADTWLALIGAIATFIFVLVFQPAIGFLFGWIGGWFAKITFGNILCEALNTLFNVTFFTPTKIPIIAGALAWIGSFFKGVTTAKKN